MIKFAILTPSLAQPGGAERTILIQLRYADPARMQCTGIALSGYGGLDEDLGRELLRYAPIHGDMPRGQFQRPRSALVKTVYPHLQAATAAACHGADVLVAWGTLALARFTEGLAIPVVCVAHSAEADGGPQINGITHLVTVSRAAGRYFRDANRGLGLPVATIPNGVEVDRVCPCRGRAWQRARWGVGATDRVLLALGRHAKVKNGGACIRALTALPPDHKLVLVGNQSFANFEPRPELAALAGALGVADRVLFLPPVPSVGDVLAGADCLLHLSFREADSLVVKEAFLAGLPVVHTPVGSIPEMEAEFGPVGWGVTLRDELVPEEERVDPREVAGQVRLALSTAAAPVVARMRAIAWERWTGAAMCDRWADYLEGVVAAWAPPAGTEE
jgi:glycosyltransferase involved in cell wall biosynthesis